MREIFSAIFDILIDPLGLPISALWEFVILIIIGEIAYKIALSMVGDMYRSGGISSSFVGSVFHWIIRLVVFIIVWAVTYAVICIVKFITVHWLKIFCVLVGLLLIVVLSVIAHKNKIRKTTSDKIQEGEKDINERDEK